MLADWRLGVVAGAFGFARMCADLPVGMFITHHLRRALGTMLVIFGAGVTLLAFGNFVSMVVGCALFVIGMASWTLPLSLLRSGTPPEQVAWRTALYRVGVDRGM